MEKFSQNKIEQKNNFDLVLEKLKNKESVEMSSVEKMDFLNWIVQNKNFLLHGSPIKNLEELVPHEANCQDKEFGNQSAVFANQNPNITMFYAIKNKNFRGIEYCSSRDNFETGKTDYSFEFRGEGASPENCLSNGSIYLLEKEGFKQGENDGDLFDEFVSGDVLKPVAELDIDIKDFPYLDDIHFIQESSLGSEVSDLEDLYQKFFDADQVAISAGWDYRDAEAEYNKIKNFVEGFDRDKISLEAQKVQSKILWLWNHHAAQVAFDTYNDRTQAIEFIDEALAHHKFLNHPNEITEFLSILYRDNVDQAKGYITGMEEGEEKISAQGILKEYLEKNNL